MPEFVQEDKKAKHSVVMHFESDEDMREFSELIGRKISPKTKGVFFPVAESKTKDHKYVDRVDI